MLLLRRGEFRHVQHVRPNRGPTKGAPELKEDPQIFLRRDADNTVTVRDV